MRVRHTLILAAAATTLLGASACGEPDAVAVALDARATEARASANYNRLCLPCHGVAGDGKGPAAPWLWPRPRDFTRAEYKWRSTDTGKRPTDEDLSRAIRHGVPDTSMHDFGDVLSDADVDGLIRVLKQFRPAKFADPAVPVEFSAKPADSDALIAEGKTAYGRLGCNKCHGESGKGDGPAAKGLVKADGKTPETTYDLTTHTFRRPRAPGDDRVEMIYRSLVTGLTGTPMPSFLGAGTDRELWAVASYVETFTAKATRKKNRDIGVHPAATKLSKVRTGWWPGSHDDPESIIWGQTVRLQREPPATLAPAQASLSADQCARCHAEQHRQWKGTLHGHASSPGLLAQFIPGQHSLKGSSAFWVEECQRCHAPLAEQSATLRPGRWGGDDFDRKSYRVNPVYSESLRAEGINCASCHVREWKRHGPPLASGTGLLDLPSYPLEEMAIYERSDFCLACHQLPPDTLLGDRPLLNTYREWLEGPYFKRGVQCQHCHMPNREHTWKGVHDPETFRQGIAVDAVTKKAGNHVSVRVRVTNAGAGHYLPTTPTPAAFVSVELLDDAGRSIRGARAEKRIGRHIEYEDKWVELEDTRIPPGEFLELAAGWKDGRVGDAASAVVTVRVEPDEYYERMYAGKLGKKSLTREQREMYSEALARAKANHYVALVQKFAIGDGSAKKAPAPSPPPKPMGQ